MFFLSLLSLLCSEGLPVPSIRISKPLLISLNKLTTPPLGEIAWGPLPWDYTSSCTHSLYSILFARDALQQRRIYSITRSSLFPPPTPPPCHSSTTPPRSSLLLLCHCKVTGTQTGLAACSPCLRLKIKMDACIELG